MVSLMRAVSSRASIKGGAAPGSDTFTTWLAVMRGLHTHQARAHQRQQASSNTDDVRTGKGCAAKSSVCQQLQQVLDPGMAPHRH
jgi:hypothetical protein